MHTLSNLVRRHHQHTLSYSAPPPPWPPHALPPLPLQVRTLSFNLKDASNPDLRARVLSGRISAARLVVMTPEELASDALKVRVYVRETVLEHMCCCWFVLGWHVFLCLLVCVKGGEARTRAGQMGGSAYIHRCTPLQPTPAPPACTPLCRKRMSACASAPSGRRCAGSHSRRVQTSSSAGAARRARRPTTKCRRGRPMSR